MCRRRERPGVQDTARVVIIMTTCKTPYNANGHSVYDLIIFVWWGVFIGAASRWHIKCQRRFGFAYKRLRG